MLMSSNSIKDSFSYCLLYYSRVWLKRSSKACKFPVKPSHRHEIADSVFRRQVCSTCHGDWNLGNFLRLRRSRLFLCTSRTPHSALFFRLVQKNRNLVWFEPLICAMLAASRQKAEVEWERAEQRRGDRQSKTFHFENCLKGAVNDSSLQT